MGHWKQLSRCNAITSFMCIVKLEYLNPDPRSWFCWQFPDFFSPFCFSAAVGLWNWSYLLFKRRWRFLQMWKVGFRRPFQRFGYYQKKDLSPRANEPWMRYHLCQVTSPQVFRGSRYVDTPCISPHHFLAVTLSGQRSRQVGNVTGMQQERLHCHENWPQHRFYWNLFLKKHYLEFGTMWGKLFCFITYARCRVWGKQHPWAF